MSILEQLGAQLRATADGLPLDAVALAAERLRLATELLTWVRQASASPIGVPVLTNATEHLEQAGYALRVGQDSIGEYLAAVGLGYQAAPPPDNLWRRAIADAERPRPDMHKPDVSPLGRWWEGRVNYLAEHTGEEPTSPAGGSGPDPGPDREAAADSAELLRQTAKHVLADDRRRLRTELARVQAPVGLGLSALTPPVLRRLATDLLGHEPNPDDLKRLDDETKRQVRRLMPRMPERVVTEQLARVCRVPPARAAERAEPAGPAGPSGAPDASQESEEPAHPTDAAVAGALLTGVLLRRLGRDHESLRQADAAAGAPAGTRGRPAGGSSSGHG